jgi:hypothetical protein
MVDLIEALKIERIERIERAERKRALALKVAEKTKEGGGT